MRRSATWRWGRISGISFLLLLAWLAASLLLDLNAWWSLVGGTILWFTSYSQGRQDQTEALGIRMIEFIKDHHNGNEKEPWT